MFQHSSPGVFPSCYAVAENRLRMAQYQKRQQELTHYNQSVHEKETQAETFSKMPDFGEFKETPLPENRHLNIQTFADLLHPNEIGAFQLLGLPAHSLDDDSTIDVDTNNFHCLDRFGLTSHQSFVDSPSNQTSTANSMFDEPSNANRFQANLEFWESPDFCSLSGRSSSISPTFDSLYLSPGREIIGQQDNPHPSALGAPRFSPSSSGSSVQASLIAQSSNQRPTFIRQLEATRSSEGSGRSAPLNPLPGTEMTASNVLTASIPRNCRQDQFKRTAEDQPHQHGAERRLKFIGYTYNASNPCETSASMSQEWTWFQAIEGRQKPLFCVEWDIGAFSEILTRPNTMDSIVSPCYATASDLQSVWISLTLCGINQSQQSNDETKSPSSAKSAASKVKRENVSNAVASNRRPHSPAPDGSFSYSIKFTSTSGARVRFGISIGTSYSGPHTHSFRESPWSMPHEFYYVNSLAVPPASNRVKVDIEIYDIILPKRRTTAKSSGHRMQSPASSPSSLELLSQFNRETGSNASSCQSHVSRIRSVSEVPLTAATCHERQLPLRFPSSSSLPQVAAPAAAVLDGFPGAATYFVDNELQDGLNNASDEHAENASSPSSYNEGNPVELVSDILAWAAMNDDPLESVELFRLAVCLCHDGDSSATGSASNSSQFSATLFLEGIRACVDTYLNKPQNAAAALNFRHLLANAPFELGGFGCLSEEQRRWAKKLMIPFTRLQMKPCYDET